MTGRPRLDTVKRSFRHCKTHGRTEFARRPAGPHGDSVRYNCMLCENETSRKYHAEVRAGMREPKAQKVVVKRPICTGCKEEIPLSGICGIC